MSPQDGQAEEGRTFERPQRVVPSDCLPSSAGDAAGQDGKRVEEALRESEERFRRLCDATIEGIVIHNENKILDANEALAMMVGYDVCEIIGMGGLEFVAPDYRGLVEQNILSGYEAPYEALCLRGDGSTFPVEVRCRTIPYDGRMVRVTVVWDITERKRAEGALRESEERFRLIAQGTSDAIWDWDLVTNAVWRNEGAWTLFGYTPDDVGPEITWWLDRIHPEDKKRVARGLRAVVGRGGEFWRGEYRYQRADGSYAHIVDRGYVIHDRDGKPVRMIGGMRDITERKRAEEALRESERHYRLLAENATDIIWIRDLNLRLTYISPSVKSILGYGVEEAMARTMEEVLTPASLAATMETVAEELAIEKMEQKDLSRSRTLELEQYCKDGSTVWLEVRMTFLRDEDNQVVGILGVSREITKRKRALEALRESEERFRELTDSISDVFFAMDRDLRYTYWNKASENLTGISAKDAIGKSLYDLFPEAEGTETDKVYLEVLRTQQPQSFVNPYQLGGKDLFFEISAYPSKTGLSVFVKDITERKRAEEALRESEERFRRLSEASFEGIVIHDKGKILDANRTCAQMFGYEVSEVIGMDALDFAAPEFRDLALQNVLSGYEKPYEAPVVGRDGLTFWAEVCARAIPYDGRMVRVVAVRDITERKRAEEALQKAREELESRVERRMRRGSAYGLTFREFTVLHLVAAGESDKEIATVLGISPLTAHKHLANILKKMGAACRTEAGVRALREELLD
jgi:PAS domain S-box-containing protein